MHLISIAAIVCALGGAAFADEGELRYSVRGADTEKPMPAKLTFVGTPDTGL